MKATKEIDERRISERRAQPERRSSTMRAAQGERRTADASPDTPVAIAGARRPGGELDAVAARLDRTLDGAETLEAGGHVVAPAWRCSSRGV